MTSTEGKSTAGEHNGWVDFTYTTDAGGCTERCGGIRAYGPLIYVAINNTYLECNPISSSKSVSDSSELSKSNLLRAALHKHDGPESDCTPTRMHGRCKNDNEEGRRVYGPTPAPFHLGIGLATSID